jgi:hypothetical protein
MFVTTARHHGVTSRKSTVDIFIAVKTSYLILVVYDVSVWVVLRESDGKVSLYGGGGKVNYLARGDALHS